MPPTHPQGEDSLPTLLALFLAQLLPSCLNPNPLPHLLLSPLGPESSPTVLASLLEPPLAHRALLF